jgi:hypothetical protein
VDIAPAALLGQQSAAGEDREMFGLIQVMTEFKKGAVWFEHPAGDKVKTRPNSNPLQYLTHGCAVIPDMAKIPRGMHEEEAGRRA